MQVTITIPDAVANRVVDAVAWRFGWTVESGLTKAQFAKAQVINFLKESVKSYEGQSAATAAIAAVGASVETDIVLT